MTQENKNKVPRDKTVYKIRGIAAFPFLWDVDAEGRTKYSDDKYKIDLTLDKDVLKGLDLVKGLKNLAAEWFQDPKKSIFEACPALRDLDIDLDEDDKYAEYKRNKVRIRAKRSKKQDRPVVYDADRSVMQTKEDYAKVSNGSEINLFVTIYCYGERKLKEAWNEKVAKVEAALDKAKTDADRKKFTKMLTKLSKDEPPFGVTLGLHAVQFLAPSQGKAAVTASIVGMLDEGEVEASDFNPESTEESIDELEKELSEEVVEDVDVDLDLDF